MWRSAALRSDERGPQIDGNDVLEVLQREIPDGLEQQDARAADEDVDSPERLGAAPIDGRRRAWRGRRCRPAAHALAAPGPHLLRDRFGGVCTGAIGEGDVCPFPRPACERFRCRFLCCRRSPARFFPVNRAIRTS